MSSKTKNASSYRVAPGEDVTLSELRDVVKRARKVDLSHLDKDTRIQVLAARGTVGAAEQARKDKARNRAARAARKANRR